ncbi:hypothetical protein BGZ65_005321, partial [Modicella reniformis]
MEATQSFRLFGKSDTHEITCHRVDGKNVVLWEDIEQVFPGINVKSASKTKLTFGDAAALAQKKAHESEIEQRLISSMTPEIQERLRASSVYNSIVQAIKDAQEDQSNQLMGYHQEHKGGVAKVYELTSKTLELTTKNSELMTKVYELTTENKGLGPQMIKLQEASDDKQEE